MEKTNIWNRIAGKEKKICSKEIAKQRLQNVLIQDRTHIPQFVLNKIQEDVKGVLCQYLEINLENFNINFKRSDSSLSMLVNIPILKVKGNKD